MFHLYILIRRESNGKTGPFGIGSIFQRSPVHVNKLVRHKEPEAR